MPVNEVYILNVLMHLCQIKVSEGKKLFKKVTIPN